MKIQTDQLSPLQQVGQVQKTPPVAPSQNFGEILAKEVDAGVAAAKTAAPPPGGAMAGLAQAMAAQAGQAVQPTQATQAVGQPSNTDQAVMDNVNSLLNQWENYAGQLAGGNTGQLRQAYGTLENIQTGVQKLKDENPGLAGKSPQISSLVNELEVMTVTEKIKFNRGDYT